MTNIPRKKAYKALFSHVLNKKLDVDLLNKIIQDQGFTVMRFNRGNFSNELTELSMRLNIVNELQTKDAFTYKRGRIKLVFYNDLLTKEEKVILLTHEIGHVLDDNFSEPEYKYPHILRENFANDVSHYLMYPSVFFRLLILMFKYRLALICTVIIIALGMTGLNIYQANRYEHVNSIEWTQLSDEYYYATPSGKKYHKNFCRHIRYRKDLIKLPMDDKKALKKYEPCLDCIGDAESSE